MIGKDKLVGALVKALRSSRSEATAVCFVSDSGLTRFANNYAHQNLHTHKITVSIKARIGKKIGVATTTGLDLDQLKETLSKAEAIAKATPEIPDLPPLPTMKAYRPLFTFDRETAAYTPEKRALAVKTICALARENGALASGLFETGYSEVAVVNSVGLRTYAPLSKSELMIIIGKGHATGFDEVVTRKVKEIDVEVMADIALDKCLKGEERADIEPGDYQVILEPKAVADALEWLSYIGFGSKTVEEGTSFLAGRSGQKLVGDNITIYDDCYNQRALGVQFDFEGMPKNPTYFFKDGTAKSCVHDTHSAARAKTYSTGHAQLPENSGEGAMATSIVMAPGDGDLDKMIQSVKRGILVTRFHYINGFIDTREGVLTGMTRDGTFLIEDGKISKGLPNLRFMQSFLEAFRNVQRISRDQKATPSWWGEVGAFLTPALLINNFRFIGVQKEG